MSYFNKKTAHSQTYRFPFEVMERLAKSKNPIIKDMMDDSCKALRALNHSFTVQCMGYKEEYAVDGIWTFRDNGKKYAFKNYRIDEVSWTINVIRELTFEGTLVLGDVNPFGKIRSTTLQKLDFFNSVIELPFLRGITSTVTKVYSHCSSFMENGEKIDLVKVVNFFPSLKELEWSFKFGFRSRDFYPVVSKELVESLVNDPGFAKLEEVVLRQVDGSFDFETFLKFIQNHREITFSLFFAGNLDFSYKSMLCKSLKDKKTPNLNIKQIYYQGIERDM